MPLLGQYEYIIDHQHPRANKDGSVYVHFLVAERVLGRPLLPGEWVHHKDTNKLNNEPDNIMVFASNADHSRFHSYHLDESSLAINENGAYICIPRPCNCIDCGAPISIWGTRCKSCARIMQRKAIRPSLGELQEILKIYNGNFQAIGRYYGVTDNAVRKWCKTYGLPHKSSDYKK